MEFIKHEDFIKMSRIEKMKLPTHHETIESPYCVLMIRTNKKNYDWYQLSAFFIQTEQGWIRWEDHDVIFSHANTHIDFEYGWIRLFTPNAKEYNWWSIYF